MSTSFDLVLSAAVVGVALAASVARSQLKAIVFLIVFGLLMALVWVRLDASDVALAEAAIGSGITGVLFLKALGRGQAARAHPPAARGAPLLGALGGAIAGGLGAAVLGGGPHPAGLAERAARRLPETGVSSPVTAVLLGFRGYDTLLEVAVLLAALLGFWASRGSRADPQPGGRPGPLLGVAVGLLAPVILLETALLLWLGDHAPGGAFQAGTLLCTGGMLLALIGHAPIGRLRAGLVRVALAAGLAWFLVVGAATLIAGKALLELRPPLAAGTLFSIELALTVSIGATLYSLWDDRSAALVSGRAR